MTEALVWLVLAASILGLSWFFRQKLSTALAFLWSLRTSLIFLGVALFIYGSPQFQDVLAQTYGGRLQLPKTYAVTDIASWPVFAWLLVSTAASPDTLSILALALGLAAFNPDCHRILLSRPRDGTPVFETMVLGVLPAVVFLAIVGMSILSATNPTLQVDQQKAPLLLVNLAIVAVPLTIGVVILSGAADWLLKPAAAHSRPRKSDAGLPADQERPSWWVMGLSMVPGLPIVLALSLAWIAGAAAALVSLLFCLSGLGLLTFSAPLTYAGLSPAASIENVVLIANLFLGALLMLLSLDTWMRNWVPRDVGTVRVGWPILAALLLAMAVLSALELNDNHEVPSSKQTAKSGGRDLATRYAEWISPAYERWRQEKEPSPETPFPVYLIAAEGGGIYAAHNTALFLATVQDRQPEFARHIFLISSVSGGSLGASVFSSLLGAAKDGHTWTMANKTLEVLSHNFLSGIAYAALFNDLPARLLPCAPQLNACPGRVLDRGLALEDSFETAWRTAFREKGGSPYRADATAWSPTDGRPALLLNATEVESGKRIVVSPFDLGSTGSPVMKSLREWRQGLDVSLATAVRLSASFPWLTPASWAMVANDAPPPRSNLLDSKVERAPPKAVRRRLVDGGYADNSGILTALDVLRVLDNVERGSGRSVRFILLAIRNFNPAERPSETVPFAEVLSPLRALGGVRIAGAEQAHEQARVTLRLMCEARGGSGSGRCAELRVVPLTPKSPLPLGWVLSQQSVEMIRSGFAKACEYAQSDTRPIDEYKRLWGMDDYFHICRVYSAIAGDLRAKRN